MNKNDKFSLTLTQEDIYFDQLSHANNALYNIGGYIRIGKVDVRKMVDAHRNLVESEEVFGIRVQSSSNGLKQYISSDRTTDLPVLDFSNKKSAESSAITWLRGVFEAPFDIEDKELFKAYLLKIGENSYWYVGLSHHLAMDGWGFSNWAKQLQFIFNHGLHSYSAIGKWKEISQQDSLYLTSKKYAADKEYWRQQKLDNDSLFTPLHYSRIGNTEAGASRRAILTISSRQVLSLSALANKFSVGVSHIFLGIIAYYFSAACSRNNLVLGLPFHSRKNYEQKQMLGVFACISPMAICVSQESTFIEFVQDLARNQKANFRHQRYPIGHIIRDFNFNSRDKNLYDIGFNYLKLDNQLNFSGSDADLVYVSHNHEATPIMFTVWENGINQSTELQIDYNLSYFTKSDIELLVPRFTHILEQVLCEPELLIEQLNPMPEDEYNQLLNGFNGTKENYSYHKLIHELFEEQVEQTPDNVAVVFEDKKLTYKALNESSNRLAHYLRGQGVEAETLIGICVERSLEMLVGILGILKAGGAYVPLDPGYPQARLKYILQDTGLKHLLTQSGLTKRLNFSKSIQLLALDSFCLTNSLPEGQQSNPVKLEGQEKSSLAYVIYTSGSTGMPKGVMVEHGNVMAFLAWSTKNFTSRELKCVLASTSINFDLSIFEIFAPLVTGGRCLIVDSILSLATNDYKNQDITLINTVPSGLTAVLNENAIPDSVVSINLAGEVLKKTLVDRLYENCSVENVYNLYGPTEDTTYSLFLRVKKDGREPSIGHPISNTKIYVLSTDGRLAMTGAIGELYLGGSGVTRGYLNHPKLTAERFIKIPFDNHLYDENANDHLYGTGDLVRYLADGELEFIGRIDDQVKIRGFRIELGEIENQLYKNSGVAFCLVLAKEDESGQKRLLAYVIAKVNKNVDESMFTAGLRESLQQSLPDYMLPSAFIIMDEFPLMPNGKIDKKALPESTGNLFKAEYVAPESDSEKTLALIWANLLKLDAETISVSDNFFELGGHSLLAVRLVAEIRAQLQRELSIKVIFEYSTIHALATQIDLDSNAILRSTVTPVIRQPDEPFIISFAQKRLWFIDQLQGGSAEYNMPVAMRVEGDFDVGAAEQAIIRIIERHETLRTVFKVKDKNTLQIIHSTFDFKLSIHDLTQLDDIEQQAQIKVLLEEDRFKSFDLSQDLMVRASFLKLFAQEQTAHGKSTQGILLFNMHHIASDGWSMGILLSEFITQYQSSVEGTPNPLPPLEIQYADYAHWQKEWLAEEYSNNQFSYWLKQLEGAPIAHGLPLDYPRPMNNTHRGAVVTNQLDAELSRRLLEIAQKNRLTPFMLLHAGLALVLSRHSNSRDIVVGTPVANRMQVELEPLIGFFVNTLVLRANTDHDNLSDYLAHARSVNLDAQAHQDVPFEQLIEHCKVSRSTQYSPLFQIMFTMDTNEHKELAIPGVAFHQLESTEVVAKFDLDISAQVTDECIDFSWTYDKSLFTHAHIETLSEHLIRLLKGIAEVPEARLCDLPMLSSQEKYYLSHELSDTRIDYPRNKLIHELFETQVTQTPNNIAVVFEDKQLTYKELNDTSNRLARYLKSQGVEAEILVGLCTERSLEMVIGILGILKAGGAYVPLDPDYPKVRLEFLLQDIGCKHLLTQSILKCSFESIESIDVIALDAVEFQEQYRGYSSVNLELSECQNSANLAYVIYTSGSTGKPKGVMMEHRGLLNRIDWMQNTYQLSVNDRVLQKTPYSFDVSVWEFIWTLGFGARLVLAMPGGHKDPEYLSSLILEQQVTVTHFVPSMLRAYLAVPSAKFPESLRYVFCSGEALEVKDVKSMQSQAGHVSLHNLYGPTEAAIDVSYFDCGEFAGKHCVPIGKPIQNIELKVLSQDLNYCPMGVEGELYIGGEGLARGYLNQPELTTERFIQNPFSDNSKDRLYKTGDLVRYLPDGNLAFIGRIDNQVKIRGFRIELGEIESQLLQIEGVVSCLVLAREDDMGQKCLVAYVMIQASDVSEKTSLLTKLRNSLQKALPDYMLPSAFVLMDKFPLTANGKVDKKALPSPEGISLQGNYVAPESESEKNLAKIWAELLKLEPETISVTSSFFELGGHSLLVISLLHTLVEQLGIELNVKDIFEAPTIKTLSKLLSSKNSLTRVNLQPRKEVSQPLPLSYAQYRVWFIEQMNPKLNAHNIAAAVKITGEFFPELLANAMDLMIKRHDILRTYISFDGDEPIQVILSECKFNMDFHDVSHLTSSQQQATVNQVSSKADTRCFDLTKAPLLSMSVIQLNKVHYLVRFNQHHIISDGWSQHLFYGELLKIYGELLRDEVVELDKPQLAYHDFSLWQKQWLASSQAADQKNFWRTYLNGAKDRLSLPIQQSISDNVSGKNRHVVMVEKDISEKLTLIARQSKGSLFNVLHAGFVLLLARLSGEHDLIIGIPVSGRHIYGTQNMLGMFLNNLPVRHRIDLSCSFKEVLQHQVVNVEQVLSNQDIPFEEIIELSGCRREVGTTPLFQIFFNMLSLPEMKEDIAEGSFHFEEIETAEIANKFDLTFYISDNSDGLVIKCTHDNRKYHGEDIEQLLAQYVTLLTQISKNIDRCCGSYTLNIGPKIVDTNRKIKRYANKDVACLFREQALATPYQIAIIEENREWNYEEVLQTSYKLSMALQQEGVQKGDVVMIVAEREANLVLAIYSVLHLGAIYTITTTELPLAAIEHRLNVTKTKGVILCQSVDKYDKKLLNLLREQSALIFVGSVSLGLATDFIPKLVELSDTACITFTSGSTGVPKAIIGSHLGLSGYLNWLPEDVGFSEQDRFSLLSGLLHDPLQRDIFGALGLGAKLVIPPSVVFKEYLFAQWLCSAEISVAHMTPAMAELVCSDGADLSRLGTLFLTGEALKYRITNALLALNSQLKIYNCFGTTETQRSSTYYRVREQSLTSGLVPASSYSKDTRLRIVNQQGTDCGVGELGQICIESIHIANGYLDEPQLTAERFNDAGGGVRQYYTGDLGYYLDDERVKYVGRSDTQVNLRGFRVELEEIENHLERSAQVKSAVVEVYQEQLVGYVVPNAGSKCEMRELLSHLSTILPNYMLPNSIFTLETFPLTANGKIDKNSLPAPDTLLLQNEYVEPKTDIQKNLVSIWCEVLCLDTVGINDHFFEIGGNSLLSLSVQRKINERTQYQVQVTDIFQYPTINELAQFLSSSNRLNKKCGQKKLVGQSNIGDTNDIAVIAMACRFPEANNPKEFWQNIFQGKESIREFSDDELLRSGVSQKDIENPNYVKSGFILDNLDLFDAEHFGFTPKETEIMDPQQRLLFECVNDALEEGGYEHGESDNDIGVFVGVGENRYLFENILTQNNLVDDVGIMGIQMGNSKDFVSTRISHKFNLTGPSVNVNTACSTSLVSIHQACESLRNGESSMALAGGASINLFKPVGVMVEEGGILSFDGRCRAFDSQANGTRFGSGAGVVLLKRYKDAMADGDTIHAVIKGSAINNDGSSKVGYTAPSVDGQAIVIQKAMGKANVQPETIGYIEAHGTGTKLGDPIEIAALTRAFAYTSKKQFCAIGTIKPNIGHLSSAAGIAGIIKTVQMLKNKMLPPSILYEHSNPHIDFKSSPFFVNTSSREWEARNGRRRAGVSSFGIGGTNSHVILEEAPEREKSQSCRDTQLIILSAKTMVSLEARRKKLAVHLKEDKTQDFVDIAYTLSIGRRHHEHRLFYVCSNADELEQTLKMPLPSSKQSRIDKNDSMKDVVFMFPGQGCQYINMAKDLYRQEPLFKETLEQCSKLLLLELGVDICQVIYQGADDLENLPDINQTYLTQPILFSFEYALAVLWMSWGVRPSLMIGHSLGEYVAACLSGVFSLENALKLIALRGRLMQSLEKGAMLSVPLEPGRLQLSLEEFGCSLAAVNGTNSCVASGTIQSINRLQAQLNLQGIEGIRLETSHAFHSSMMEPILVDYRVFLETIERKPPTIPFVSNITGKLISEAEATSPDYWTNHLRATVQFANGMDTLIAGERKVFLEVGPGKTLTSLLRAHNPENASCYFTTVRHKKDMQNDEEYLLTTAGRLWLAGINFDWQGVFAFDTCKREQLPTYVYQRKRYWIDEKRNNLNLVTKARKIEDWFYEPMWKMSSFSKNISANNKINEQISMDKNSCCLVFVDSSGISKMLTKKLLELNIEIISIYIDEDYKHDDSNIFHINPGNSQDYLSLMKYIKDSGKKPNLIIHTWNITPKTEIQHFFDERLLYKNLYSLLFLCQALEMQGLDCPIEMKVFSNNTQFFDEDDVISPHKSVVTGIGKVISTEYPNINYSSIDIIVPEKNSRAEQVLINKLTAEVLSRTKSKQRFICYRENQRWYQSFEPMISEAPTESDTLLKHNGVYVISGGLGSIAFSLAQYLAESVSAKIILFGGEPFPCREQWDDWLTENGVQDPISRKILKIRNMQCFGAKILVFQVDIENLEKMQEVIGIIKGKFGGIDGVIDAGTPLVGEIIANSTPETFRKTMLPEINGKMVLAKVLEPSSLDFFMSFSGFPSMIGGRGCFECSAVDAYQEAFSFSNIHSKTKYFSINLVEMDEFNMAEEVSVADLHISSDDNFLENVNLIPGAKQVFERLFHNSNTQIVVSRTELDVLLDQNESQVKDIATSNDLKQTTCSAKRPDLDVEYVKPMYQIEIDLVEIWGSILGIKDVGTKDNFFELGGDSLLLSRVVSRINEKWLIRFSLRLAFEKATIAGMALSIVNHLNQTTDNITDESEYEEVLL